MSESAQKSWWPALSLACSTFIFVSTEFMPVGLLPEMAEGLHRSQPEMGLILTVYAWTVAIFSLPLTVVTARFERKRLLLVLLFIFTLANIGVALAPTFLMLLIARIVIALSHAIFWSIVTPLAYRVAPLGKAPQALGVVIAGACLATVLGVPVGTALGHQFGWRLAFAIVSFVAMVVFFVMLLVLPNLPSINAGSLKSLPLFLKRPALLLAYVLIALIVTGHFVAYTYLTPFLGQHSPPQTIVLFLLVMGLAGVVGSMGSGALLKRFAIFFKYAPIIGVVASLLLLEMMARYLFPTFVLCFVWGFAMTSVGLVLQTQVLTLAHDATDVATALFSGIYNIGIGAGAFIGATVFHSFGLVYVGYVGSAFVIAALILMLCIKTT